MPRCFLTGLEIELKDAFVLDLTTARRIVRELQAQVLRLQRHIELLGGIDRVEVPRYDGTAACVRRDRRLVSAAVAHALNAACPGQELFVPWSAWCSRGRIVPLIALRSDPDHGRRLSSLSNKDLQRLVALADDVLARLAPGIHLSHDVRNALLAGVCAIMRDHTAEEVAEVLADRLRRDESLDTLGVPFRVEPAFRAALGRACRQPWALPVSAEPPAAS